MGDAVERLANDLKVCFSEAKISPETKRAMKVGRKNFFFFLPTFEYAYLFVEMKLVVLDEQRNGKRKSSGEYHFIMKDTY